MVLESCRFEWSLASYPLVPPVRCSSGRQYSYGDFHRGGLANVRDGRHGEQVLLEPARTDVIAGPVQVRAIRIHVVTSAVILPRERLGAEGVVALRAGRALAGGRVKLVREGRGGTVVDASPRSLVSD